MIAILKYNAGNVRSVQNALNRMGYESIVTDKESLLRDAQKVIMPGVGEAASAMKYLRDRGLDVVIKSLTQPFLGICLGLQIMCKSTEEGNVPCLNIFDARVKRFPPQGRIPHMGWNDFDSISGPLFEGIDIRDNVYYVHSFYAQTCVHTSAVCRYILPFSAALQKDNYYATQFHPEKSGSVGEIVLQNFLRL
ncbi:MAG: imidazole glycerol phosphate synthase subunit HisH [Bacteroidales bacterium]|nr:imidazole glycerol phosphate synthase subunit HisH [Bacteroidales bacterium]